VPKEHLARTDVNSSSPGTEPAGGARSARDGASGIGEWAVDASFLRACAARLVLFKKVSTPQSQTAEMVLEVD